LLLPTIVILCAVMLLIGGCQQRETPQWAPNVERTDITPSEWMVGCFKVYPMTDRLRAVGACEEFQLTARRVDVFEGRQRYRVEMYGSHLQYGVWTPIAASKIRVHGGSNGFGSLTYVLSRSNDGLVGTYQEIGDVPSTVTPHLPVSLRRVACVTESAK
jgi:hypothetical protein